MQNVVFLMILMDAQSFLALFVVVHGKMNYGIYFLLFLASFYELHSNNIVCCILLVRVHLKTIYPNVQAAGYIVLHHMLPSFEQNPTARRLKTKEAFFAQIRPSWRSLLHIIHACAAI